MKKINKSEKSKLAVHIFTHWHCLLKFCPDELHCQKHCDGWALLLRVDPSDHWLEIRKINLTDHKFCLCEN